MNAATASYLYAGLTVVLWSTVATAFKLALRHLDPLQVVLLASLASTAVLLLLIVVQGRFYEIMRLRPCQWLQCAGLGLLNPFCYYFLLFQAYALLPAQVAQAVNSTWAIMLALLSVPFLGQKLRLRDGLCMLLGYGGVLVVASGGDVHTLLGGQRSGIALAFASTFMLASYWIANARMSLPPVIALFASFLLSLPWVVAATLLFSTWPLQLEMVRAHGLSFAAAVHVGLFEMGLGYWLWITALKLSPSAARLSLCAFCVPFLSLFWITYILHESIAPTTFVGVACIVMGGILQSRKT